MKNDSQRELELIRNNSRELYERENRNLREAKEEVTYITSSLFILMLLI